jgi:hypothetical protein
MKKMVVAVLLLLSAAPVFALQYENPMLNMAVPSGLEKGQMYFQFEQKFYQALNSYPDSDHFALLDGGANLNISIRYMAIAGIELNAGYTVLSREKTAGASYVLNLIDLNFNIQAGLEFFSYYDYARSSDDQNLFYYLALQNTPLLDGRLIFTADAAYDGYNKNPGAAIGVSYEVVRGLSVLAEYYPVIKTDKNNKNIGDISCYSAGFKIQTSGHQFIFKFGNSYSMGIRQLMLGVKTQDIYAGFEIMRLIVF